MKKKFMVLGLATLVAVGIWLPGASYAQTAASNLGITPGMSDAQVIQVLTQVVAQLLQQIQTIVAQRMQESNSSISPASQPTAVVASSTAESCAAVQSGEGAKYPLSIISPAVNANIVSGSDILIKWNNSGCGSDNKVIAVIGESQGTGLWNITSGGNGVPASQGYLNAHVPALENGPYRISLKLDHSGTDLNGDTVVSNAVGVSVTNASSPITASTSPALSLTAPTWVSIYPSGANIVLKWNSVPGAYGYGVYKDGEPYRIAWPTSTTWTDVNPTCGVSHTYSIDANNGNGNVFSPKSVAMQAAVSCAAASTVKITSPAGGLSWSVGETHDITWSGVSQGIDIALYANGPSGPTAPSVEIAHSVSGNSFAWTIPTSLDLGDGRSWPLSDGSYILNVYSDSDGSESAWSQPFNISTSQQLGTTDRGTLTASAIQAMQSTLSDISTGLRQLMSR